MTDWKKAIINRYGNQKDTVSIFSVDNPDIFSPLTDGFDHLVMVVARSNSGFYREHFTTDDQKRIQLKRIGRAELETWIMIGQDRRIIPWLVNGEILVDPDFYLSGIKERLNKFPQDFKEKKLLIEFNQFLARYLHAKEHLHREEVLDAHSNVLLALHHWARLSILDSGSHPEVTVWNQVKQLNPGIYKLYDELIQGNDTVQQRIQLVLLACEFQVMSKMEYCCQFFLHILKSKDGGWTLQELHQQKELSDLQVDFSLLLKKLVKKGLIQEITMMADAQGEDGFPLYEIRYG